MRAGKTNGAAVAMAADLMKERRERFRVVFIVLDLIASPRVRRMGRALFLMNSGLVSSLAPPERVYETACSRSFSPCPAPAQARGRISVSRSPTTRRFRYMPKLPPVARLTG